MRKLANRSLSIVLVDDEPSVLNALTLMLEAISYKVTAFTSGQEAVLYLASGGKADIFLCDFLMPNMNGLDTLMQSKEVAPEVPFILLSGNASPKDIDSAFKKGAKGFLGKPFSPDELGNLCL